MAAQAQVIEIPAPSPEIIAQQSDVTKRAKTWPERANQLQIKDQPDLDFAAAALNGIKDLRKEAAAVFDPVITAAHEAHKTALAAKKQVDGPLEEAERTIKRKIGAYAEEQRRIAEEEERKAREAEEARQAQEREAAIEQAEADGASAEEVQAICEAPLPVAPQVIAPVARPKAAGISLSTDYFAEVQNVVLLAKYVVSNPSMAGLIAPNMPALNTLARSTQGKIQIPGVVMRSRPRVSNRG